MDLKGLQGHWKEQGQGGYACVVMPEAVIYSTTGVKQRYCLNTTSKLISNRPTLGVAMRSLRQADSPRVSQPAYVTLSETSWCPARGQPNLLVLLVVVLEVDKSWQFFFLGAFDCPGSVAAGPHSPAMQTSNPAHAPAQQRQALCTSAGTCMLHTAQRRLPVHRHAMQRELYSRWVHKDTLPSGITCS